jgi:hypothetical protein
MQKSLEVRNAYLDAQEVAAGVSPIMKLLTGAMPANCAAAQTGTVVATLPLPSDWMLPASGGVKSKSGTWEDVAADAGGLAGYYRIYSNDGSKCHFQGIVSQPWAASTAFAVGQQVNADGGKVYKCTTAGTSAASGGPAGTGASITDGGCVWQYIGVAELILDNTNFALGQAFAISNYSWTAGNA